MKPTIQVEKNLTKRKLINRVAKALEGEGMIRELMLFNDYSELAGPCKKGGRLDVREVAEMFVTLEDFIPKKKKKKARK